MATNLLLGTPGIPLAASSVTPSYSADPFRPAASLFGGNRTDTFRFAPGLTAGGGYLAFALPAARAADFLFVGNADWLKAEGVTGVNWVRGTTSNINVGSTVVAFTDLTTAALAGPNGSDLLVTAALTPTAPYWFVSYVKSGELRAEHSKLFFGSSLDLGRDPEPGVRVVRAAKAGAFARRPLLTVSLKWTGVSYAKAVEFYQTVVRPAGHQPVLLFTTQWHGLLSGHRCLLGRVTDAGFPPVVTGSNDISLTVEELL